MKLGVSNNLDSSTNAGNDLANITKNYIWLKTYFGVGSESDRKKRVYINITFFSEKVLMLSAHPSI